jgi:hypothetical protein
MRNTSIVEPQQNGIASDENVSKRNIECRHAHHERGRVANRMDTPTPDGRRARRTENEETQKRRHNDAEDEMEE